MTPPSNCKFWHQHESTWYRCPTPFRNDFLVIVSYLESGAASGPRPRMLQSVGQPNKPKRPSTPPPVAPPPKPATAPNSASREARKAAAHSMIDWQKEVKEMEERRASAQASELREYKRAVREYPRLSAEFSKWEDDQRAYEKGMLAWWQSARDW